MYNYDDDNECGHHCREDCPNCGEREEPPAKKPAPKAPRVARKWCGCEGGDHNHGCPNGM